MQISAVKKTQANKNATPLPILMKDMCKIRPNPLQTKKNKFAPEISFVDNQYY